MKDAKTPTARPEFSHLSELEIGAALANMRGGPIVAEVTRLSLEYAVHSLASIDGSSPTRSGCLTVRLRCPIERISFRLCMAFLTEMGASTTVVTIN